MGIKNEIENENLVNFCKHIVTEFNSVESSTPTPFAK